MFNSLRVRHAEVRAYPFYLGLDLRAHAHLRIRELAVSLGELVGQGDFGIRVFRRVDPEIV